MKRKSMNHRQHVEGPMQTAHEKMSRRKMLATMGISGAAFATGAVTSQLINTPIVSAEKSSAQQPITDDADRISYGVLEKTIERTVGNRLRETVSVLDFGAVGDGQTDDTAAFNAAVQYLEARGGGTLHIPNNGHSVYLLKSYVVLCDHLRIISDGAILKKDGSCENYYVFVSLSGQKQGYGSGASHIVIYGLHIQGSFEDVRGASITLHHSQHVWIKNCLFTQSVIGGHSIDLGGCSDVLISNCVFKGFHVQNGREYVEAIQIDHSTAEGIGTDHPDSYDGLACRNVIVRECKFLPLTVNGTTYPAPNPFGSHSRVIGQMFMNIAFINNVIEDGSTVPDGAPYAAGLLHFYHIDGLEISGNIFINRKGNTTRMLGLYSIGTAISQEDVANSQPPKVPYDPVPAKNVWIERNKIIGFKSPAISRVIYLQGREVNQQEYFLENISISQNHFIDCYDLDSPNTNVSSDLIFADKVIGLHVFNNYCSSVRRLLYGTKCHDVQIAYNRLYKAYYVPISIDLSSNVHLLNNMIDTFRGGFYTREIDRLQIKDNTFVNEIDDIVSAYGQIISVNKGNRLMIKDNYIDGSNSAITRGISVYAGSSNGRIKDNWLAGFSIPINVSADSSNIIVDDPL